MTNDCGYSLEHLFSGVECILALWQRRDLQLDRVGELLCSGIFLITVIRASKLQRQLIIFLNLKMAYCSQRNVFGVQPVFPTKVLYLTLLETPILTHAGSGVGSTQSILEHYCTDAGTRQPRIYCQFYHILAGRLWVT